MTAELPSGILMGQAGRSAVPLSATPPAGSPYRETYWEDVAELDRTRASEVILEWLDPRKGDALLDVGCGLGRFAVAAERLGAEVTGIEPFTQPLATAKKRMVGNLVRASAENLPFVSESFEKVLCNHVLEHTADPSGTLGEIHRVMRNRGRLVLSFPNSGYLLYRLGIAKQHPTHRWALPASFSDHRFRTIKKRVFASLPGIGDKPLEILGLSKVPGLRNVFYNVIMYMEKK
jgi:2-polyprenyl-3-methyl-5-hydroxy-6-metoxy-1,4-benzoquinol methylase